MKDRITTIMRRTHIWKYENGTAELLMGGCFLLAGIALPFGNICIALAYSSGLLIIDILGERLKQRYIYPRSGLVVYQQDTLKWFWKFLLFAIGSVVGWGLILSLLFIYDAQNSMAWFASFVAACAGILWVADGLKYKLVRLDAIGIFSICLGLSLSPIVLGRQLTAGNFGIASLAFYLLVMSITFFISGGLVLRTFLRNNPLPEEAPDEQ